MITTFDELKSILDKKYLTAATNKLTRFGSEYVRVKGITFRLSDHNSKWVHSSHIDVMDYQTILEYLVKNNKIEEVSITLEDFVSIYTNGGKYNDYEITEEEMNINGEMKKCYRYIDGVNIRFDGACKCLYYFIFKK